LSIVNSTTDHWYVSVVHGTSTRASTLYEAPGAVRTGFRCRETQVPGPARRQALAAAIAAWP
jgi:hypothetical protein